MRLFSGQTRLEGNQTFSSIKQNDLQSLIKETNIRQFAPHTDYTAELTLVLKDVTVMLKKQAANYNS